jgi:16S rRNA (uracil1498-N3)-methyltransferase
LKEGQRKEQRRRKKRKGNPPEMRRIVLDRAVDKDQEVLIMGPPLEALRFQGSRVGSLITLSDSRGRDFRGRVLRLSEQEASILLFDRFPSPIESPVEIILLQALPEKERMELIIQKATELGVSAILAFKSKRSISLEEREEKQKKAHRWQQIAIKAVQQSRRAKVPEVSYCPTFRQALETCKDQGIKIMLYEREGTSLKDVVTDSFDRRVYAIVGPEGGFTEAEVKMAEEEGFVPIKLGQRILRTETASITLVGILQYELGDLK